MFGLPRWPLPRPLPSPRPLPLPPSCRLLSSDLPGDLADSSFGSCLILLVGIFGVNVLFGVELKESLGVAPRVKSLAGLSDGSLPGLGDVLLSCLDNNALAPKSGVFLELLGTSLSALPSLLDITAVMFAQTICFPAIGSPNFP